MNDRHHSFETPSPARLRIEIPSGQIIVTACDAATTDVDLSAPQGDANAMAWLAAAEIAHFGDEIVVRGPKGAFRKWGRIEARIRAPAGSDAKLSIGAGGIETHGKLGKLAVNTGAGAIKLDACDEARARTGAGDVEIGDVTGSVDAKTAAGHVTVGRVGADVRIVTAAGDAKVGDIIGSAKFSTAHGAIEVASAGESLEAVTASGDVDVRAADHGRVQARTVSGRVSVGVANGVAALLDISTLSGRVRSDLVSAEAPIDGAAYVELVVSTVSGNVNVMRA